jgi:hypothetical protein
LCPSRQLQVADAIDAGAKRQRSARLCRLIDRTLERLALIVSGACPNAKLSSVDTQSRQ